MDFRLEDLTTGIDFLKKSLNEMRGGGYWLGVLCRVMTAYQVKTWLSDLKAGLSSFAAAWEGGCLANSKDGPTRTFLTSSITNREIKITSWHIHCR